jgi:hypothetical protein
VISSVNSVRKVVTADLIFFVRRVMIGVHFMVAVSNDLPSVDSSSGLVSYPVKYPFNGSHAGV